MAGRTYAQLYTAVWQDDDWCALTLTEQGLYTLLLRQSKLSLCGVLDYMPKRWRTLCGDDRDVFDDALETLEDRRYVVIDRDTDELLVRTFVKHDLKKPSFTQLIGVWNAYQGVMSKHLRDVILRNLPDVVWECDDKRVVIPDGVSRPVSDPDSTPPDTPCDGGYETPCEAPIPKPFPKPEPETSSAAASESACPTDELDPDEEMKCRAILDALAKTKAQATSQPKGTGWYRTVVEADRVEHGAALVKLIRRYPTAPAQMVAAHLLGETTHLDHYRRADLVA